MPDYSKGKIYTIRCKNDPSLIYVGSTIQSLSKRWGGHKCKAIERGHYPLYSTINGKWKDFFIELFELYPCSCKEELLRREGEIIRELGTLNKVISGRTDKEYYIDYKDKIKEQIKKYQENNKEKIKEIGRAHV